MIQTLKKHGVKAALPLLLLATACDDPNASSVSSDLDVISSNGDAEEIVASLVDGLDNDYDGGMDVGQMVDDLEEPATAVPEPATFAGLAIAALGLGAIKRKSA